MVASWDKLVNCNEGIGLIKRFMKGIDVNEDTLAVEVIDEVGPSGHFLQSVHNFKEELWFPRLLNRKNCYTWMSTGKEDFGRRVKAKVKDLLTEHHAGHAPVEIAKKIDDIVLSNNVV